VIKESILCNISSKKKNSVEREHFDLDATKKGLGQCRSKGSEVCYKRLRS